MVYGLSYVSLTTRPVISDALLWHFIECDNHMWKITKKEMPIGIQFEGNSDWHCLNYLFVDYIVNSQDEFIVELKEYFKTFVVPTEVRMDRNRNFVSKTNLFFILSISTIPSS